MKKCMGCMRDYQESEAECPLCGYSDKLSAIKMDEMPEALAPQTILGNRFILGRVLSYSDYSIVYIAWDALLSRRIAVKEYFPYDLAKRGANGMIVPGSGQNHTLFEKGRQCFEQEILKLSQNQDIMEIVNVYRTVRENGTSYMIMEYLDGYTLQDYLDVGLKNCGLSKTDLFTKIMKAVEKIHARGIGHYNLSPDNILVDEHNDIRLIDFGDAKRELYRMKDCRDEYFNEVYTAPEVMLGQAVKLNADLYSLGTIYYSMLLGKEPVGSVRRFKKKNRLKLQDAESERMINLLSEVSAQIRPASITQFWQIGTGENVGR